MTKHISTLFTGTLVILLAVQANAGVLSIGSTSGSPGDVVTVSVSLSNLELDAVYSSVDAGVIITPNVGTGTTPVLTNFNAGTTASVWSPFTGVTLVPPATLPADNGVFGVLGNDAGVTTNLTGLVMDIEITIPATATVGDVFNLDLSENFSNITDGTTNPAQPLSPMPHNDGTLTVTPEPGANILLAFCLVGLAMARRRLR